MGSRRIGRGEGVVVADHDQDSAVAGAARHVAVADRVHAPVETRTLAVPHGEDSIVAAIAERRRLLRAPDRGRGQVLVDGRLEVDVGAREKALGGPQLLVDVVHRGAAVAGDVAGGVEARDAVSNALHHREPHERLAARDVNPSFPALVLVVQRNCRELHDHSPVTATGYARVTPGVCRTPPPLFDSTAAYMFEIEFSPPPPRSPPAVSARMASARNDPLSPFDTFSERSQRIPASPRE